MQRTANGDVIQLWSYNYDPEPTGIGPVSRVLAHELVRQGYVVEVVAAHPHYPEPRWGRRAVPYREMRDGIPVLRLPLWVGRATTAERYRQELTFMSAQMAALPVLGRPALAIVVSPSFPALLPAVINARIRRIPWMLWLHDILPDGAAATGLVESGTILGLARKLEQLAYREADRIVVLSAPFVDNLRAKGVPADRIQLIYDPATREPAGRRTAPPGAGSGGPLRLLSMGNIGHSQGLAALVRAFERPEAMPDGADVLFTITGNGVAADDCRAEVRTERVRMVGLLDSDALERELLESDVAFVSQQYEGSEFNIPSKLMNFMAYGLPVIAAVNPGSEVARIVRQAGAGWVVDSSQPDTFPAQVAELLADRQAITAAGEASARYAAQHFTQAAFGEVFAQSLAEILATR